MSDKYPSDSGRRRFVKGVVGSAALSGVGVGGAATVNLATQPAGGGGGPTEFVGIQLQGGPAPRGMPYIPIEIEDNGDIRGVWPEAEEVTEDGVTFLQAEQEVGGRTYSTEWFQYCGRQQSEGIQPDADKDNYFRSVAPDDARHDWQAEQLDGGDTLNVEHFSDYETWGNEFGRDGVGKPAKATWRSDDVPEDEIVPVTVIRSTLIEEKAQRDDEVGQWYSAASSRGVIAYMNVCTHFCCVPGYKFSESAAQFDIADGVYCQCHQSQYDPFTPEFDTFVSLPRPD
ncbi:cytochrome B [Halobacteriales archaeon QH_7_69_31]|nr:MAG: cytochrome B [Halobacteriales archaeon QH_7_69_31]